MVGEDARKVVEGEPPAVPLWPGVLWRERQVRRRDQRGQPSSGLSGSRAPCRVERFDAARGVSVANALMKVAIVVAFVVALTVPLDHLDGKGMAFRAPLFCGAALVVPVIQLWWRKDPYPHTADALVVAPFLVDTVGNLAGFYDNFAVTDDVLHAVNWVLLVGAFHAFRFRAVSSNRDAWLLGAGFGALAIVGWEIAEWIVAETGAGGGLNLTYGDTIGDLALSTAGGMAGSAIGVAVFGFRRAVPAET